MTRNSLLKCTKDLGFEQVIIKAADIAKELQTEEKFETEESDINDSVNIKS